MSILRIVLFGGVRLTRGSPPAEIAVPPGAQALLAYLLLFRHRRHPREVVAGLFWGEQPEARARACLNTALWRLRGALHDEGTGAEYILTGPGAELGFATGSEHWLDVAAFEEGVERALARPAGSLGTAGAGELDAALRLYTAPLLDGRYEPWVLQERERLHRLFLAGQTHLMRWHRGRGEPEQALACGQRLLQRDPLHEETHREVMQLYAALGQRGLALQQYRACREALARELEVEPAEETLEAYRRIAGTESDLAPVPGPLPPARLPDRVRRELVMRELRNAQIGLDLAWARLQRVLDEVEQLAGSAASAGHAPLPPRVSGR